MKKLFPLFALFTAICSQLNAQEPASQLVQFSGMVITEADGRLMLEPYKEIPAREAWLFENPASLAAVRAGLADAAEGRLKDRGDFGRFAEDDD